VTRRGWQRLGAAVRRDRVRRQLTQAQFAEVIGLKPRTISNIERASKDSYDPATIDAVELAMGWQVGSVDRVINGQEPVLVEPGEDASMDRLRELWPMLSEDAKATILRLIEYLVRAPS
jgi:transcriptional regulator with XRE-family HTH domain